MTNPFESLGLRPELVRAVTELGYENPTPIQEGTIPALLDGRDVLGQAQTGTGKTAAFALPMLDRLDLTASGVQGLVLVPTRELAIQVAEAIFQYGRYWSVRVLPIYGGSSYTRQIRRLQEGVHVVVGTPGRVIDLIQREALDLSKVRYLVLDEADEMLKMGFIDDVETILKETPSERQTALFSATLSEPIRRLSSSYMHDPVSVTIARKELTVPQTEQRHYLVTEDSKVAVVARLLEAEDVQSALIFTRTKVGAAQLAETLMGRGFPVEAIHGDLSQEARETVMRRFRKGHVNILVATDVAARGLDIENVSHVINFDMPYDAEDYVHRIGRTGRAGREGVAITLVTPRERRWLKTIGQFTKHQINRAKLPSREEVYAKRDQRFVHQLDETLAQPDLSRELEIVNSLQESGYDLAKVSAAAIRMARALEAQRPIEDIREPREREERPPRPSRFDRRKEDRPRFRREERTGREPGMVRLMMNVGREQGIKPGDVVGAIAGEAGIPGRAIGAIDIRRNETYVDVKEIHVERVLRQMKRSSLRGKAVTLKRAQPEQS
ncbi:MAG TPA: DEAD/DEAH box helicase [Oceanobacillus sp.]|nr:DEAD/DEAH box helicase [Oceanobacillus sp.]